LNSSLQTEHLYFWAEEVELVPAELGIFFDKVVCRNC
jgi:hypothetical protein